MESSGRGHRDGVEITSIGVLYQGPLEKKYWSSSRGKEKYPYPIGYQATRWHGGHCYFMEVLEGPRGPSFVVKCEEGITCSGQTPSVAWEDILKKKHAGAKRVLIRSSCTSIDGAEMFGFTNPLVQRLCRDLVVSASGAAENSDSLPDEEVKDCKGDAAEGAHRKGGSLPESSEKSPVKARRGKKFIQLPNVGVSAEEKEKDVKQRVASRLEEEEHETKESRKQKMKKPARESVERSEDIKVVERTQISTTRKDNSVAQRTHPEDEEMPRSKRPKVQKAVPHADEDMEQAGPFHNVGSANSKRAKSLSIGTQRMKGEDRQEGKMSMDCGKVISPHGLSDGARQNNNMDTFVKEDQESSAADGHSEVPDLPNVDEASQRNASSRKKRMKLAKPQKILDSVKSEKYDTEVDLTQSEGFLSIDLMCPNAEDMKKETSGGPVQKFEDVSSKQDGYLMLLAACKVAEVEQKNFTQEKTGTADVKRKRPLSDIDSTSKAAKAVLEVASFPTSSKAPRLSAGHVEGVYDLASSSSDMLLEEDALQILSPPGKRLETDFTPGKDDLSDIKVSLKQATRGDELSTVPQFEEDVITHDKHENVDIACGRGEKVPLTINSDGKMEKVLDKCVDKEEDENSSSHISERPVEPDQVHANNAQTIGKVNSSLKSQDLPSEILLLYEQVWKSLKGARSGVQPKDTTQQDEGFKVSDEIKCELKDTSPLETGRDGSSQSGKLSTAITDGSATSMVVNSDAVPLREYVNECSSSVLNEIDPGQVEPHGLISAAQKVASSHQGLESEVEVADVVEDIYTGLRNDVVVEMNGTTCDVQIVHLSDCAVVNDVAVGDEDLPCKELQLSRSLTTAATTATVSQYGPEGTSQPVLSVRIVEGSASVINIGCSERAIGEPCSPVVKANRIEMGTTESFPEELIVKLQPAHSVTVMREIVPNTEVGSQGLDQHTASIEQGADNQVGVDLPLESVSCPNSSIASQCEECPRNSLKQALESLSASVTSTSEVCFGTEFSKLENKSSNSEDENGMVRGESPKNIVNLPRGVAADVLLTSSSQAGSVHAVDLRSQSKDIVRRTLTVDVETSAVFVDRMEFDHCLSADRSTQNTTKERFPAVGGAVKSRELGVELNLRNFSDIGVNTVLSSDQGLDMTTGTLARKESRVSPLDVDICKGAVDHLETHREGPANGTVDFEMMPPVVPPDHMESVVKGSSSRSKEDKMEECVPATVDTESGAKFEHGSSSANGCATALTSRESVGVPLCTVPHNQVFDSKGSTEMADRLKKDTDLMETPGNQIAETDVVSSDPFVDKIDCYLTDGGAAGVMEKICPTLIEASKDTEVSMELALRKSNEPDVVTICGQNHAMSSSTDIPYQRDQGSQVFDLEGGVECAVSSVLVHHQAGCVPSDCGGPDEGQKPGAKGEVKLLLEGGASDPALGPGSLDAGEGSSSRCVHSVNFQVSAEGEEIKHPVFISPREESTIDVTTSVTTLSSNVDALEGKHAQVDACTNSNRGVEVLEAVSPLPSQMQSSASLGNQSQRSESDSVNRELTTSMMTLLLPEAVPFLSSRKRVEKKEASVVGADVPSKTGDMDVGASVSLVGSSYDPSELPAQADVSPGNLEAGRVISGDFLACKASTTVAIVEQLRAVNYPGLNQEETDTYECRMEIDPEVNAGNLFSYSNGNVQVHTMSGEVCHLQANVASGIGTHLERETSSERHAETSNAVASVEKDKKSKHLSEEFARSGPFSEFAEDDCEISQPALSSGANRSDLCQENPEALILNVLIDDVVEHPSSGVTSQVASLNHTDTRDSVEGPGLKTSSDISSLGGAEVRQEVQVCTKVLDLDPDDKITCTRADMKIELVNEQLAGCNISNAAALETLDNQESDRVGSFPSDVGVGLKISTNIRVEQELSLVEHLEAQVPATINCQIHVGEDQGVYREEFERCGDPLLVDKAQPPNVYSRKVESTSRSSQDAQSDLLRSDAFCCYLDHSEGTKLSGADSNLSENVNHAELYPQRSCSSTQGDESVKMQPSCFQKMKLPISIEHPTKVSTMVINVQGDEIRLCVCCGIGSERTLSVFKILYTKGAHLEHQLLTVVETFYKNHHYEEGTTQLVSEESALSFTPDGRQLILLDSFQLRNSTNTGTHDGHGIKIVSFEGCQSSTRLESEETLLCLTVREPQRLVAAGEDGHVTFWDMDSSWRSFENKVSMPQATLAGVPFTSVTSLSVVPHLRHMVVGCNPSGFFALWDMNCGALLYTCRMFDDLLLKTSLVDTKCMNWEQTVFSKESVDGLQITASREYRESLAALPLICFLTMVTSRERFILESREDVLKFKKQKPRASEGESSSPAEVNARDTDAALLKSHNGPSESNERIPQHKGIDKGGDLEHEEQNFRDEVKELISTDPNNYEKKELRKIPGPWNCKTILMRGGRIVCGHALSDCPTSITSMGRYGVMGTADGLVHLWDVENGRKVVQLDDLEGSAVVSLATSSSLAVLATAGENKRVNVYLQKDIFADDLNENS